MSGVNEEELAQLNARGRGALDEKMGIEILEASPTRLVGRMPVDGNTQPFGLLHGGANVVLAESLGSIGAHLHAGLHRRIVGSISTPPTTARPNQVLLPPWLPPSRWGGRWQVTTWRSPMTKGDGPAPRELPVSS